MSNDKGLITLDFIFAITVSMGFVVAFFALATTFAAIEVAQYIAFASARVYAGAHSTQQAQTELAQKKFDELIKIKPFQAIFRSGWYTLKKPDIGNHNQLYQQPGSDDSATFWGVRIPFEADVIDIKIPFIGRTKTTPSTGRATIASYLMREPSDEECRLVNSARLEGIKKLDGAYNGAQTKPGIVVTDNGC